MRPLTRRELLAGSAGALAAACATLASSRPARAIPPIGRTRPSHLKLSIAAYSYRKLNTDDLPTWGRPTITTLESAISITKTGMN